MADTKTDKPATAEQRMKRLREITEELVRRENVDVDTKTQCLATALYDCTKNNAFYGSMLQLMNISYTHGIERAAVGFNADNKRFDLYINPYFFCKKLSQNSRRAVLLHEIFHVTHRHVTRVPMANLTAHQREIMNIAADMAINQYIKDLPDGCDECRKAPVGTLCTNPMCPGRCIDVKEYKDKDEQTGKEIPWPGEKTMEFYYEKLLTIFDDPEDEDDGSGNGTRQGKSAKDMPQTLDEHFWDGAGDEKDQMEATEDLVKRAMIKQKLSVSDLPGAIKDLLEEIEARRAELDYKGLILAAIKRSASGHERKHTWSRRSRRFGVMAPGTTVGDLPKLHMELDSSGSISIEEMNEFLDITDNFLKAGSRKCRLAMFHTKQYYNEEYKLGQRIDRSMVQSGGTDLTASLRDIFERRPDLSIFLTDGCYGDVDVESWMKPGDKFPQVLFIISKNGADQHPLRRLGSTIKVPSDR